jgi:hypothetical protein
MQLKVDALNQGNVVSALSGRVVAQLDLGERRSSRLVAAAAEDRLNI